jgi:hypothetical protein
MMKRRDFLMTAAAVGLLPQPIARGQFGEDVGLLANLGDAAFADATSPDGNRERILRPRVGPQRHPKVRSMQRFLASFSSFTRAIASKCEIEHIAMV